MDFKKMIEELCAKGMTESQIAFGARVSQATISRLRLGYNNPRLETFFRLQKFYNSIFKESINN